MTRNSENHPQQPARKPWTVPILTKGELTSAECAEARSSPADARALCARLWADRRI